MKRSAALFFLCGLTVSVHACGLNDPEVAPVASGAVFPALSPPTTGQSDNRRPERLIRYIETVAPAIRVGSPEYSTFLKDILWGVHSDLLSYNDKDEILRYAASYLNENNPELPIVESPSFVPGTDSEEMGTSSSFSGFDRSSVVSYAYRWAEHGRQARNNSYPSFSNDCTNFISQAVLAGGVPMTGAGECKHEATYAEWYTQRSSGWLCFDSWAWSTSWSVVDPFSSYHFITASHARASFFDAGRLNDLRGAARPGDVVQLRATGGSPFYHSMIVTKKAAGEIYFTYHSGPGNQDVVDRPLAEIARSSAPDLYRLLVFQY